MSYKKYLDSLKTGWMDIKIKRDWVGSVEGRMELPLLASGEAGDRSKNWWLRWDSSASSQWLNDLDLVLGFISSASTSPPPPSGGNRWSPVGVSWALRRSHDASLQPRYNPSGVCQDVSWACSFQIAIHKIWTTTCSGLDRLALCHETHGRPVRVFGPQLDWLHLYFCTRSFFDSMGWAHGSQAIHHGPLHPLWLATPRASIIRYASYVCNSMGVMIEEAIDFAKQQIWRCYRSTSAVYISTISIDILSWVPPGGPATRRLCR